MKYIVILVSLIAAIAYLSGCKTTGEPQGKPSSAKSSLASQTNEFSKWYPALLTRSNTIAGDIIFTYAVSFPQFDPTNIVEIEIWIDTGNFHDCDGKCVIDAIWCKDTAKVFGVEQRLLGEIHPNDIQRYTALTNQDEGERTIVSAAGNQKQFEEAKNAIAAGVIWFSIHTNKEETRKSDHYVLKQARLRVRYVD